VSVRTWRIGAHGQITDDGDDLPCVKTGDRLTRHDLATAWVAHRRARGEDPAAAETARIAQSAFGIELTEPAPPLERTWVPAWAEDPERFNAERRENAFSLSMVMRGLAGTAPGADPFAGYLEVPAPTHEFFRWYRAHEAEPGALEQLVGDLIGTLWNLPPDATAIVSTAAQFKTGETAARILTGPPADDEPIACPRCGWTGTIGETEIEYFSECAHRECPKCSKMLVIF
jgi:hypothetical protein